MAATPIVDSHLHLWQPDRLTHRWLSDEPEINKRFWADEFVAASRDVEIRAVFIQADCLPDEAATEVDLVSAVAADIDVVAIVAHAPVDKGPEVDAHLEDLMRRPLVRGVRYLLQDLPIQVMEDEKLREGIRACGGRALTFDLCIRRHQIGAATELVSAIPEVVFVLDHLGKPQLDGNGADFAVWRRALADLARRPNVVAKLSGLSTETSGAYDEELLGPFVRHAIETFGPDRLMFGSDWPVSTPATTYPKWRYAIEELTSDLSRDERDAIWWRTASSTYRLGLPAQPPAVDG